MPQPPNGTFKARVIGKDWGQSTKGKDELRLEFGITEPGYENCTIWHRLYFSTEKGSEYSFKTLETCGWDGVNPVALDGLGSKEVEIVIDEEEYDGKFYQKVKWVNDPDKPRFQAPADGLEQRINAMRARTRGTASVGPQTPTPVGPPPDNSDIPF